MTPAHSRASLMLAATGLAAVTAAVFWRIFDIGPFSGDNFNIIQWASHASLANIARADPSVYPEWRPLAYLTVLLQYRWSSVDATAYFVINLLLWIVCGWLVLRIVDVLTHSRAAGFVAAGFVLSDYRAITALAWIDDRQSSMACLFGLLAVYVVVSRPSTALKARTWMLIAGLLLASALSKEYGVAFAIGIAAHALFDRRRDLIAAATAAVGLYATLRLAVAGGAVAAYCESMGYFASHQRVCLDALNAATVKQASYNVVATGLGTLLPGLFSPRGQIELSRLRLLPNVACVVLAAVAWWQRPRESRITWLVLLSNAAISVMLYRTRNHLVGLCACGIAVGVGWSCLQDLLSTQRQRLAWVSASAAVVTLLGLQTISTRLLVSVEVNELRGDPCAEVAPGDADVVFARLIKHRYGLPNPDCHTAGTPKGHGP